LYFFKVLGLKMR